jgi:PTS system mannose-specific IIC component
VFAIDDRAGWQGLFAQPVFICLVVGYIFGEVIPGLIVGLSLELIWFAVLPMRGTRRPDQVCGAIVGAASACSLIHGTGDPRYAFLISFGVFLGLLAGEAAARISQPLLRIREERLNRLWLANGAKQTRPACRVVWAHVLATSHIFVVEAVVVFSFIFIANAVSVWASGAVGGAMVRGIEYWGRVIPAFGAASLIHVYWHKHLNRFLILSVVFFLLVLWIK